MASKKSFSLFWRIFLPLVIIIWIIIGIMLGYAVENEKEVRKNSLMSRIQNINATIIDAYEQGTPLRQSVDLINTYYNNTAFYDLRISVFDTHGSVIAYQGIPIETDATGQTYIIPDGTLTDFIASDKGEITVVTSVPINANIEKSMGYSPTVWFIVFALAVIATGLVFIIARRMALVVKNLHKIATEAAAGETIHIDDLKLPHDEIGEMTRKIITLYREKDKATKRMIHEHQVALRAIEEKDRTKRQFAGNLNHEIKTPVSIIKGYIDTILADPDIPVETRQQFLKKAQEHADRLTGLIQKINSIALLDDTDFQVETNSFDFHDLAYSIASDIEAGNLIGDMAFEWDIPFDTFVVGNFSLLGDALMNLVRNAHKYSKGTVITLSLIESSDTTYTFSFADNGEGVAPGHLQRLFERFYRIEQGRSRKSGGSGLGLPIVKSTFIALGGDISVRNATPHGLEFIFTLNRASKSDISKQNTPIS